MEIKSTWGIAIVAFIGCMAIAFWQFGDGGLDYVRAQLRADQTVIDQLGPIQAVVATKTRYMTDERVYWVIVIGKKGTAEKRVSVRYSAGKPQSMEER